jgi:hypothetical protein
MASPSRALVWRRIDTTGAEYTAVREDRALHAHGTIIAAAPVPHTCRYEVLTDETGATVRLEVTVEGSGFQRSARLERAAGRWRVTATEQGDLDAALRAAGHPRAGLPGAEEPSRLVLALDVDLDGSPLMNTLPIRRLGIAAARPGTAFDIEVAWLLVPSLEVVHARQTYTALGPGRIGFASGDFTAELDIDSEGYVTHYPGLAELSPSR